MKNKGFILPGTLLAVLLFGTVAARADAGGAAYTMTNAPDDNQVVIFSRNDDGLLTLIDAVSTGGKGSGGGVDPLGSQGSLVLVEPDDSQHGWSRHGDKRHDSALLLAVNAGSNDISVLRAGKRGIRLQDRAGSGGSFPVSVTVRGSRVYVLNNGEPSNITGFRLDDHGHLSPLPGSTRLLGEGSYGQVAFGPQGKTLIVTDKANSRLLVYRVHRRGIPSATPVITPSAGDVPFAIDFDRRGHLLIAEAGSNAVSSYAIARDGHLNTLSASVANGQIATCWIVANQHGDVITTNPGTNSLSSFHVDARTGQVTLLNGTAGSGDAPLDIDVTGNGRFAYAVDPANGGVDMFRIERDGSLTGLGNVGGGLSQFAQGMAVR